MLLGVKKQLKTQANSDKAGVGTVHRAGLTPCFLHFEAKKTSCFWAFFFHSKGIGNQETGLI